jgi:hypothetical protein
MTDRVAADDDGIWLMGSGQIYGFPWTEIAGAAIYVLAIPPDDTPRVTVDIGHICGDYVTIDDDVEGFAVAVAALVARGGCEMPDPAVLTLTDDILRVSLTRRDTGQ